MKTSLYSKICKTIILAFTVSLILGGAVYAENLGAGNKVNINMAAVKVLAKLPGIGKKKAEAIVSYRNEKGKFNSVDDLKNVEGIGKKTLEKLREHITTEGS